MTTPEDTQTSLHGPQARQESPPDDTTTAAAEPSDDDAAEQEPEQARATANAESARWRVKCREAEAERDALTERVANYQRKACEDVIADLLDQPADLWLFGDTASDFFDGDVLAEDQLRAAVAALLDQRPGLAKTPPPGPRRWGQTGGNPTGGIGWGDVLKH